MFFFLGFKFIDIKNTEEQKRRERVVSDRNAITEKNIWSQTKTGSYEMIHQEIKSVYTITSNYTKKGDKVKIAICKTKNCPSQCKIVLIGGIDSFCEFYMNQYDHSTECQPKKDLLKCPELINLCHPRLTPNEIIVEFNKKSDDIKIPNTDEFRRKISQLKYKIKSSIDISSIHNMSDLKNWLDRICIARLTEEEFKALPWDQSVVADYEILGNKFIALVSTKNLQLNTLKQMAVGKLMKAVDGTYKLNEEGHPSLVSGVYDSERKFHLSNIIKIYYLIFIKMVLDLPLRKILGHMKNCLYLRRSFLRNVFQMLSTM